MRLGLAFCLIAAVLLAHCAFEAEARTKLRFRSQDLKPRDEIASVTMPISLMESQATVTVRGEEDDASAEQAGTAMDEETDDVEGEAEMEAEEERNAEQQAGVKPALLVAAGLADQPDELAGDDDILAANPIGAALLRNFENAEAANGPGPAADAEPAADEADESPTATASAATPSAPAAAAEAKSKSTPSSVSKDPNQAANPADEEEQADIKTNKAAPAAPKAEADDAAGADDVTAIVKTNHAEEDEANPESIKDAAALKAAEAQTRGADQDETAETDNFYPHLNSAPHRHAVASKNGESPLERLLNDPDDINWYDNAYGAAYPAPLKASADAPNVHDAHRFKAAPAKKEEQAEESSEDADDEDDENSEEASEGAFAALKVFKFSKDHSHGAAPGAAAPSSASSVPANKLKGGLAATGVTHTQNAAKVGDADKNESSENKGKKGKKHASPSMGSDRELNELEVAVKQEEERALAEAANKQKTGTQRAKRSGSKKSDPHGWAKEFPDLSATIATSFLQLQEKIRARKKEVADDDFSALNPSSSSPAYLPGTALSDYATYALGSTDDLAESAAFDLGDIPTSDLDMDLTPRSRRHRFRALAPTAPYQAPVPTPPSGYQAPVPSAPAPAPATPPAGYQGPTPPSPPSGYQGPPPSPYGAPVPTPPPAPYGGKVPPYGGPVLPPSYGGKPPGYGGQVPPPPYGGYMGGYQGKVQVPVDKLPTFGIPAEYMAAFKKGSLVLLRGPAGPKGDQGVQGPTGAVNATVLKEIETLKKKIQKIKNNKLRMEAIERKVYPFWAAEPYACPDEWLNLGYVESEQRVYCRPPSDGTNVGNPLCRTVAKFPKRYDRCTWTIHCNVEWKNYGCWPFGVAKPKEYTDAQESKIPQLVILPGEDSAAATPGHPKVQPAFTPVMPTSQAEELNLAQDLVGRVLNPTADPLLAPKAKGLKLPILWNPTDAKNDDALKAGAGGL